MAGIDLNRTSAGAAELLPKEISQEIWANAVNDSVIMQAARRINLPGSGVTIPIITGDAEAGWVNETDEKPVSGGSITYGLEADTDGYNPTVNRWAISWIASWSSVSSNCPLIARCRPRPPPRSPP